MGAGPGRCGFWEPLEGSIRGVTTSDVRCGMNVIALVGSTPTGATRGQGGSRQQSPERWSGEGAGSGLPRGGGNGAAGRATAGTQRVWAA